MLQRAAVAEVEPFSLVSLRLLAALTFFLPVLPRVWRGLKGHPRRALDVWLLGAMNPFLTGVLSAVALMLASSGVVAVLNALAPVLTAVPGRFLLRGNVIDLVVAVVIGAAFKEIVDTTVKGLITPLLGVFGGVPDFSALSFSIDSGRILVGEFVNAIVAFIILAAVIDFVVVVPTNRLMARLQPKEPEPRKTRECPDGSAAGCRPGRERRQSAQSGQLSVVPSAPHA